MCDASKEMHVVVTELLAQMKAERERKESTKMFSVKDLTIPLVLLIPMLLGGVIFVWNMSTYFNRLETSISQLQRDFGGYKQDQARLIDDRTKGRFTRSEFIAACIEWQRMNTKLKLNCDRWLVRRVETITIPGKKG